MRRALACLLLALFASAAHGFVPGAGSESRRLQFRPDGDGRLIVAAGAPPRVARVVDADRVAGWHALRDRDTGVVSRIWGRSVAVPGAVADAAIAERAARAFLAQHLAALAPGARSDDLVLVANRVDAGKRTVAFVQTHRGLRVVGGQLHVVFANDRLFVAGSEALPRVQVALPRSRALAPLRRTRAWLPGAADLRATGERVVLPIVRGRGDIEYRVADVVLATAGHQRWDVYVAPDGAPLARRSRVHHATSTLHYDVGARYASGARMPVPAALAEITVDGEPTTTAADGTFGWPTSAPATVEPSLAGTVVRVIDEAGNPATAALTAQPNVPVVWSAATDELADAQLSAYVYTTIAKAAGRRIDPTLAWLDQQLAVHVNYADACNAFSTGDSIHFFRASAECENTARVADVVHHELGHSFHQQSIIPGAGGTDFSIVEGLADFFAANISGDPGVGRGFFFNDEAVRELDPVGGERVYPRDLTTVSHTAGLIIGGALWDLRKQLIAKLGTTAGVARAEQIFLGILQRAPDVTAAYTAALVADDDDGDLGNGTPNRCVIESAFGRHGLAGAEFRETTLQPPVFDGRRVAVTVDTPTGTACPPAQVTGMRLAWRVRGGAIADIAMTAQGATWTGELPAQPAGTVVEFQVIATLDTRETLVFPDNPADPYYQHFSGTPAEIWCERFDADPGWKQEGAIEWDVAVANPVNAEAGDPATAFAGTSWLGTDLRGDGRYRADILTSIHTPPVDASAYGRVHLQFRRWLTIEDAALDVATIRINGTQIWANATTSARTLDHVDKEWRFVDFDVTPFAAEPISVAWTLASDPTRNLGGWNLDEICLVGLDKQPRCGDGIVDPGEDCDEASEHCTPACELVAGGGGGCCSGSGGLASLLFGLGLAGILGRPKGRGRS